MSDPSECALSIAAMVKDWYESPHKSDIPATIIDRRMARFEPSPALAALAMRERAAEELDSDVADLKADASRFRQGTDPYHGRMAFAEAAKRQAERIRALPATFTDAELLAAAMQLPEVRALVDVANAMKPQLERRSYESLNMYTGKTERHFGVSGETWSVFCAALAPFMKGGE